MMKTSLSVMMFIVVVFVVVVAACSRTTAQNQPAAQDVVVEPVPSIVITPTEPITQSVPITPTTAVTPAATLAPAPLPLTPTEVLTSTPPPVAEGSIPPAPAVAIPAGLQPVLIATFDEQPDDWQRRNLTFVPGEEGLWVSENGMLAQKGLIQGGEAPVSRIPTMLLAPATLAARSSIAVQVYPEDNQVIGLVFRASDEGFYLFRISRENGRVLQRYDILTEEYTTFADAPEGRGFEINRWQELRIELDGDLIQCFFDDELVFEYRDSHFSAGQAGVYTLAMGFVFFDNLTIAAP